MTELNWTCLFCHRAQTVSAAKRATLSGRLDVGETAHGKIGLKAHAYGCSNPECKEVSVLVDLCSGTYGQYDSFTYKESISTHLIRPESHAKQLPNYVPRPIVEDYTEACKIRDMSPKASATLSRRCLQGIIRDFCGISKSSLFDEIETLREQINEGKATVGVTPESADAIDAVRKIGNIGAHMEKDINIIVDVDPDEAQALIELIESLIDDWYVARNSRQLRFAKVSQIAEQKKLQKDEALKLSISGDGG